MTDFAKDTQGKPMQAVAVCQFEISKPTDWKWSMLQAHNGGVNNKYLIAVATSIGKELNEVHVWETCTYSGKWCTYQHNDKGECVNFWECLDEQRDLQWCDWARGMSRMTGASMRGQGQFPMLQLLYKACM